MPFELGRGSFRGIEGVWVRRLRMAAFVRVGLKVAALGATFVLLLAHSPSGDVEAACSGYPAVGLQYDVSGACGPAGAIVIAAAEDSCDLWLEGDDVALPRVGTRDHAANLERGGFKLYDPQEPRAYSCVAQSVVEGELSLACTHLDTEARCTALLRRRP